MGRKHYGTARTVAMFLAFSISQVYVHAIYAVPNAMPNLIGEALMNGAGINGAKTNWAQGQLSGTLITRNNQPITVDGATTNPGATIFSGAHFQTPDGVSATVDLGPLGVVDFEPNTDAVLTFTDTGINVKLKRGCAAVRTKNDVKGIIINEDGTTTETDAPKNRRRISVCFPLLATAASTGISVPVGTIAAIAAGIGAIIAAGVVGRDTTTTTTSPTPTPTPTPENPSPNS